MYMEIHALDPVRERTLLAIRDALLQKYPHLKDQLAHAGGLGTIAMHLDRLIRQTAQQPGGEALTRQEMHREICPRCTFKPPGEACELRRSEHGCMLQRYAEIVLHAIARAMLAERES
ncbi:hypothetical protein BH09PLA1_BH09PLA1_15010 [soil metagenome]